MNGNVLSPISPWLMQHNKLITKSTIAPPTRGGNINGGFLVT